MRKMVAFLLIFLMLLPTQVFANGLSKGMVTFIFDDGNQTVYDNAFPVFKEKNVPANLALFDVWDGTFTDRISVDQAKEMQSAGWEIMSHGMRHINLGGTVGSDVVQKEIIDSKQYLTNKGFAVNQYVAPYNVLNPSYLGKVKQTYQAAYVPAADPNTATVDQVMNTADVDVYNIKRVTLEDIGLTKAKQYIDYVAEHKTWLVLYSHNAYNDDRHPNQTYFRNLLDYIQSKGVDVVTGSQAVDRLNGSTTTITITPGLCNVVQTTSSLTAYSLPDSCVTITPAQTENLIKTLLQLLARMVTN